MLLAQPAAPFNSTPVGQEKRLIVQLIDKAEGWTPAERTIARKIIDFWFRHRSGEGVIHPGAERLAKITRYSIRWVRHTLGKLRSLGFIVPVKYAKGGRNSTRYMVDIRRILDVLAPLKVRQVAGSLVKLDTGPEAQKTQAETASGNASTPPSKPCTECRRYKSTARAWADRKRGEWMLNHLSEGIAAAARRWIAPQAWLKRDQERSQQAKTRPLAAEITAGGWF